MKNNICLAALLLIISYRLDAQPASTPVGCNQQNILPRTCPSAAHEYWLAGGATMLGWRKNFSYRISDIAGFLPQQLQQYVTQNQGLPRDQTDVYLNSLGMINIVPANGGFTQAQICDMLQQYGPIWMFGRGRHLNTRTFIIYGSTTIGGTPFFQVRALYDDCNNLQVPFSHISTNRRIRAYAAVFPRQ